MSDYYVPGIEETDLKKVIQSLQQAAGTAATAADDIVTNTSDIATNTADIATNTAAIATLQALGTSGLTASLSADVNLNNTANYFDGPSIAQGTTGTWFVSGTVTAADTAGAAGFSAKLWDGTTVIASTLAFSNATNQEAVIPLSGIITNPAGNLRISVRDFSSTSGKIEANRTNNGSKDSTITAFRIA